MTIFHDEIEIEDFEYDEDEEMYYYPCPCGDRFQISGYAVYKSFCSYRLNSEERIADKNKFNGLYKICTILEELLAREEVATCPSCSLVVKVIVDLEKFIAEAVELHKEDGDKETVKA